MIPLIIKIFVGAFVASVGWITGKKTVDKVDQSREALKEKQERNKLEGR